MTLLPAGPGEPTDGYEASMDEWRQLLVGSGPDWADAWAPAVAGYVQVSGGTATRVELSQIGE